jgi:NAD(P)-dependent dehydrogenase (short-subunit alcohol dehydrogenase family)
MERELLGKVAMDFGGKRGTGLATAIRLAEESCCVVIAARRSPNDGSLAAG